MDDTGVSGTFSIGSKVLRVDIDRRTGSLQGITWRDRLPIVLGRGGPAAHLRRRGLSEVHTEEVTEVTASSSAVRLTWRTGPYRVDGSISVAGDAVRFRGRAHWPPSAPPITALEWPSVSGVLPLTRGGSEDALLHPYATGLLLRDPWSLLMPGDPTVAGGLRWCAYPEGFAGASMQFVAVVGDERCLMLMTEDPEGHAKWINGFLDGDRSLTLSVGHANEDLLHPAISPGYDTVLRVLPGGSWRTVADAYRVWAVEQPWCGRGYLRDQQDRPRWLHEDVGLVTFGINAARDRRPWIDEFARIAGSRVFHITGPNWTAGQDYMGHTPGGIDEWFPDQLHAGTIRAARRHGHRIAPFIFSNLVGDREAREGPVPSRMDLDREGALADRYRFDFRCPATPEARALHRDRDVRLVRDHGFEAVYYDIAAHNVVKECLSQRHEHAPGGGRAIGDAFLRLHRESRSAMRAAAGYTVAQGTELINELHIGSQDFYQARGQASPASSLETDVVHAWIKDGRAAVVPVFTAVYHDYGPVRTDGWAKLSREQGDYFYAIAREVVLTGGLFQLNYEYSPLEVVGGVPEPAGEHYYTFPDGSFAARPYRVDEEKVEAIQALIKLRTSLARDFLAYGRMLPPPSVPTERLGLGWFHYNGYRRSPAYEDSGVVHVDAVGISAWELPSGRAAILFNVDRIPHQLDVVRVIEALATPEVRNVTIKTTTGQTVSPHSRERVTVAPRQGLVVTVSSGTELA